VQKPQRKISSPDWPTHHIEHNPSNLPPLEQVLPQFGQGHPDPTEKEKRGDLRSDAIRLRRKKNGIRGILHIRPEGNRFTSRNRVANTIFRTN